MESQIRWHGRGGAGVVTAARLLGLAAAMHENLYAQSFAAFGPERRGAPVQAFNKISTKKIRDRSQVYDPGFVVVMEASLLLTVNVQQGLKKGGIIIINSTFSPESLCISKDYRLVTVDATGAALQYLGVPIVNTAMLGAFCAATGLIKITSVVEAIKSEFGQNSENNIKVAQAVYDMVKGVVAHG